MDLISYTINENTITKDEMINIGKIKLTNNEFMKDLCDLMEDEKFLKFYKKYMMDWTSIKCTSIYMRLYSEFKTKYETISKDELDKNIIIFILSKIMTDSTLRPLSIEAVENIQKTCLKRDFFAEFEKMYNQKKLLE
jgi:hypothetical protein|tara:strand:+ start:706 stop:1116 length:411 start_codon:yes stop_codon:yes gene_type:complete